MDEKWTTQEMYPLRKDEWQNALSPTMWVTYTTTFENLRSC